MCRRFYSSPLVRAERAALRLATTGEASSRLDISPEASVSDLGRHVSGFRTRDPSWIGRLPRLTDLRLRGTERFHDRLQGQRFPTTELLVWGTAQSECGCVVGNCTDDETLCLGHCSPRTSIDYWTFETASSSSSTRHPDQLHWFGRTSSGAWQPHLIDDTFPSISGGGAAGRPHCRQCSWYRPDRRHHGEWERQELYVWRLMDAKTCGSLPPISTVTGDRR